MPNSNFWRTWRRITARILPFFGAHNARMKFILPCYRFRYSRNAIRTSKLCNREFSITNLRVKNVLYGAQQKKSNILSFRIVGRKDSKKVTQHKGEELT